MKNFFLMGFSLFVAIGMSYAQVNINLSEQIGAMSRGLQDTRSLINFSKPLEIGLVGDYFYNAEWYMGNIYLKNGKTVENVAIKYHVKDNQIIFNDKGKKMLVAGDDVTSFAWMNHETGKQESFINAAAFNPTGKPLDPGFVKIWTEGEYFLLSQREYYVKESDYYTALDVGRAYDEIKAKEYWLLAHGKDAVEIPTKKKEAIEVLQAFLGTALYNQYPEKVKFKNEESLRQFVEWLNRQ